MNNKTIGVVVGVIIVIILAVLLWPSPTSQPATNENTNTQMEQGNDTLTGTDTIMTPGTTTPPQTGTSSTETPPTATVKTFTINGGNMYFKPAEMRVKKGDTVRVTFKNDNGFHDFVLDAFNVRTKQIQVGQEETIEFVADKTGTFEYYCSVGQHRQMGMKGNLIVE